MRKNAVCIFVLLMSMTLSAQIPVIMSIDANSGRHAISPYIFGSNGQSVDEDENITARRLGGNRLTGYNWEINASNAGSDYIHSSDDYLLWIAGIPSNLYDTPNVVYKAFHDTSLAMHCYSLLTLPMAGYVSADFNGTVDTQQTAPSVRFKQVVNRKGSAFSLTPDTTDGFVYIDECINQLLHHYGTGANHVQGYSMDNEYALWNSTHPRIHPQQPTIGEVIHRSVDLSSTIKDIDSTAEVFGPADYGYASFLNFQSAPDWLSYSSYGNFIGAYLHGMKTASDSVGHRLLDAVDVHWYPEAQGRDDLGNWVRVTDGANDRGIAEARMQCPRTLWDSSYVENSWIGQWFSPCVYVPALLHTIDTNYPGTKLAFTEYYYGGTDHISGGIAVADVLGIFTRYGIYFSSHWGPLEDYVSSAFKIYRNYDGNNSTYGDLNIGAQTTDISNSSVYASLESNDTMRMHLIVMNKNYDSTLTAMINIQSATAFTHAEIRGFDSVHSELTFVDSMSIAGNAISLAIPPLTVYHIVLSNPLPSGVTLQPLQQILVAPNPVHKVLNIHVFPEVSFEWEILNIFSERLLSGDQRQLPDVSALMDGNYFLRVRTKEGVFSRKIVKGF